MNCRCLFTFLSKNALLDLKYQFVKDEYYTYTIDVDDKNRIVYFVSKDNNISEIFKGFPFSENIFMEYFDNKQELRENKLSQIIN